MEGRFLDTFAFAASSPCAGRVAPAPSRASGTAGHGQTSVASCSSDGQASSRPVLGAVSVVVAMGFRRQAAERKRRKAAGSRGSRISRRFFNFGGPEEEVDPNDPGRQAVCKEYQAMGGEFVCAEQSDFGWAVVSRHNASENDSYWPGGHPDGPVIQEWRELRLADSKDAGPPPVGEGTGQSVVKVSLCGDATPAMVPYCMTLGYTKTLCAVAMTGAHLQGALPMGQLGKSGSPMRALVVGLGAGSMPVWLGHTFPEGSLTVDAVEIDPAVVKIAKEALGFPAASMRDQTDAAAAAADALAGAGGESVRVYTVGGETFVEEVAKAAGEDYKYDMVFIDAFDKKGKVPPVLVDPEGVFLQGLQKILTPKATVVLNLLVGMTGSGSSGGPKEIEAMVSAINRACCTADGEIFSCRPPMNESSGNQIYGFLRVGRNAEKRDMPLKDALREGAQAVNAEFPEDSLGQAIRFDFARRVVFGYMDWPPNSGGSGGNKGFFGFS